MIAGRPAEPDISGDDWLRSLPKLLSGTMARWELTPDGDPRHGVCALVVPVRTADGASASLKIAWPHTESRHEHLALRAWDGNGAVPLLAADPSRSTMLLARLDADRDLLTVPLEEACAVIGGLLARLDRPALPQLARLSRWAQRIAAFDSPAAARVPRRLVQQASRTATGLLADDVDTRLVHADLHYENVLAGPDGWTAIDPKPVAGEPAYGVWPALHNRFGEWSEIGWGLHLRLGWICDAAGIDEDRARGWALVRAVGDAVDAAACGDDARLTTRIMLAKALAQRF